MGRNGCLEQSELACWNLPLAIIREVRLYLEVHRTQDLGHFKVHKILSEGPELENLVGAVDKSREKEEGVNFKAQKTMKGGFHHFFNSIWTY